jgi:phosphate transport system substrate-binding protein
MMRNTSRKIAPPNGFFRRAFLILLLTSLALLTSGGLGCGRDSAESPTSGNLVVFSAESVAPALQEIVSKFDELYKNAHITVVVSTSREVIVKLLNNEATVIVSARRFNAEEQGVVKKYDLYVDSLQIAYDGVAAIVHPSNLLNQISVKKLGQILTGKVKRWKDLSVTGRSSPEIFVAMGGPNTSVYDMMKNDVAGGDSLTKRFYPCSTSTEVIRLVEQRPEAIGFVGVAWVPSESSKLKVLELGTEEYFTDSAGRQVKFFLPELAHIYRSFYPLRRTIYIYSREKGYGLGAGFITFVASPDGQKILMNHGLVPGTQKIRLVRPSSESS